MLPFFLSIYFINVYRSFLSFFLERAITIKCDTFKSRNFAVSFSFSHVRNFRSWNESRYAKSGQMTMHRPTSARVNTTLINVKSARTFLYKSGARTRTWFRRLSQRTRRWTRLLLRRQCSLLVFFAWKRDPFWFLARSSFVRFLYPYFMAITMLIERYSHTYAYFVIMCFSFLSLSLFLSRFKFHFYAMHLCYAIYIYHIMKRDI